jgi:uncharacterized surface protein with fasciclin (FAS1) repeats
MQGELPEQFSQHYLGLEPSERDAEITLALTYDPQDSTELARRINFFVFDQNGFKRYQAGESASSVAVATGTRSFLDPETSNRRQASFKAAGFGPYTVLIQNGSQVPATYELTATGGELVDDAAQTLTAQQAGGTAPAVDATGTTTTTAAAGATTTTTATATAGTGVVGEPGGSYTVQSGDTLAIIARDIYGDYRLYEQLCAFNNIADCNVIEVGQAINLPTEAEIGAVAAAPAAAATTAATPAATVAAAPAATTTVTSTAAVTGTAPVTTTAPVTGTAATTRTTGVGATTTTTRTTPAANAASGNVLDVLEEGGNYTILLAAIEEAGLTEALSSASSVTLFAPTDEAFNNLFTGNGITEARFLQIPELAQLLQLHVVPSRLLAADMTNGLQEATLQGSDVTFTVTADGIKVNDSFITDPDQLAGNGVVQPIDAVILPATTP